MPQASAFVTALRYAEAKARMGNLRFVHLTARIKADLRWWQRAADLTSCRNASILQTKVTAARVLHGDAGTEWGLGGYDGTTFYKAKHTPDVLRAAMRHKRHSSKFLELFNVLVMARIYSADWTGQHVSVSVDNHALPRACERLTSRSRTECAILHEIAMLQIRDGWTWDVTWIPRSRRSRRPVQKRHAALLRSRPSRLLRATCANQRHARTVRRRRRNTLCAAVRQRTRCHGRQPATSSVIQATGRAPGARHAGVLPRSATADHIDIDE